MKPYGHVWIFFCTFLTQKGEYYACFKFFCYLFFYSTWWVVKNLKCAYRSLTSLRATVQITICWIGWVGICEWHRRAVVVICGESLIYLNPFRIQSLNSGLIKKCEGQRLNLCMRSLISAKLVLRGNRVRPHTSPTRPPSFIFEKTPRSSFDPPTSDYCGKRWESGFWVFKKRG